MAKTDVFHGKRMALAGFGAEGRSAAYFLIKSGARVEVFDSKSESEFSSLEIADLRKLGVIFYFGALGPFIGFDAIVRSPGVSPHVPELAAAAKQGIPFTSATKIFFDVCPCEIAGVTGTKGKGTTSSMIYGALLAAGRDAYLCGNIGAPALNFLDKLRPDSVVVYELSSFQLMEVQSSPKVAVVLMVTSEHLDFHKDVQEYIASKANIVRFQTPEDHAVINMDYPASRSMAELTSAEVFGVSRQQKLADGAYVDNGQVMIAQKDEARVILPVAQVPLAGAHNLENVCAAAMAAALLGVPDRNIADAIRSFKPLPHRLELVREVCGVKYYDDSISTTPESAIAALRSFAAPKVMILGGSNKGATWEEFAGILASDHSVKAVVGIGAEWPKIKAALASKGFQGKIIEDLQNMTEVVQASSRLAEAGDIVVLSPACASFGMFRNYKDRGEQFAAEVNKLSPESSV